MLQRTEFSFDAPETLPDPETSPNALRNQAEQKFQHHLTLGIEKRLGDNPMIRDVKLIIRKPVEKITLSSWERKNCVVLPSDLREYYLSTNGFRLGWNLEHAGDSLRIGDMGINSIGQLVPVDSVVPSSTESLAPPTAPPTKAESNHKKDTYLQMSFTELQLNHVKPSSLNCQYPENLVLGPQAKAFRLDSNRSGWGTVCLVYPKGSNADINKSGNPSGGGGGETSPNSRAAIPLSPSSRRQTKQTPPIVEIWFMDPSCQWHFLAPTFTHYYRMLLMHLGLPQWQYRFTPFGLSAWAEQMFWVVAPQLLQPPKISYFPNLYSGLWSPDFPSEAATPNTTNNVISINLFRKKKKDKPPN